MPVCLFDFSDQQFRDIICQPQFALPIRWDGRDFESTLQKLLSSYCNKLSEKVRKGFKTDTDLADRVSYMTTVRRIEIMCSDLQKCVSQYHSGFPSESFSSFQNIMDDLVTFPLNVEIGGCETLLLKDDLELFRLRAAGDRAKHKREEMFHVPASSRSLVSTCRYSIAGHPSLYLTDSIDLGVAEFDGDDNALISRYELVDPQETISRIGILDLAIKPQDFAIETDEVNRRLRTVRQNAYLNVKEVQNCYLLWYPVIAACSFIRAYKKRPFAPEYIIPQLLMQWLRTYGNDSGLMGIRYFSCASMRASNLGLNYVFPTYDTAYKDEYCSVLQSNFKLTEPVYCKDFSTFQECRTFLRKKCTAEKI